MFLQIIKLIIYLTLVIAISKYILVKSLRNLAEALNLKSKTVGNIAGIATSVPELLTTCTSSLVGLSATAIYNIISSNIINLILYLGTVILNKNVKKLKNREIGINMIIVAITIIIPIKLITSNKVLDFTLIPFLAITFFLSIMLDKSMQKLYIDDEAKEGDAKDKKERNYKKAFLNVAILIVTGIVLFYIGNGLGNTLEILCERFRVSQMLVGIILGFLTSIPELITFFESQKHHKIQNQDDLGMLEATNNLMASNSLNLFFIFSLGIILGNGLK